MLLYFVLLAYLREIPCTLGEEFFVLISKEGMLQKKLRTAAIVDANVFKFDKTIIKL